MTRESQLWQAYTLYRTPDQMFQMACKAISPRKTGESELEWEERVSLISQVDKASERKGYIESFCELDDGPPKPKKTK